MSDDVSVTAEFEAALDHLDDQFYVLRLYVVGATPSSRRAIMNLTALCDQYLGDRYALEVIDVYQRPELAAGEDIIAAPTLVRVQPEPTARLVGDLSDAEKVLAGLDLRRRDG